MEDRDGDAHKIEQRPQFILERLRKRIEQHTLVVVPHRLQN